MNFIKNKLRGTKASAYIQLHLLILLFSLGGICSKMASRQEFLSPLFILFYGLLLLDMAIYAFAWQQILKKLPLTSAYLNKSVGMIWTMLWGVMFFNETLTLANIIGAAVVLVGVCLVVSENE